MSRQCPADGRKRLWVSNNTYGHKNRVIQGYFATPMDARRHVETFARPSHGENRGSSPLGSANDFSILAPKWSLAGRHLQLFSNGRCFRRSVRGHAVIVGSRRPEAIYASPPSRMGAFFQMTALASRRSPRSKLNMPPVCEKTERPVQPSSCRRVCRQVESRRAEARKNRSPRCLRGTKPRLRTSGMITRRPGRRSAARCRGATPSCL